ncbi:MAG TPA: response regulator [Rhodanobacter sp.]|nr:response regulator [Rhodanobacter sp.]
MASEKPSGVRGLRILMVEDEMLLALSLEDMLRLLGCEVVKAARLHKALKLVDTEKIDGALLDVNLDGESVYPVAAELDRRGIPYAFMSGYGSDMLDADYRDRPALLKPFVADEMERVMVATFRQ